MGKQAFEKSLAQGRHRDLAHMAGDWEGTFRLWFEADQLACESPQSGTLRSILGGRFLLHEYRSRFDDTPIEGVAIYGYHIDEDSFECSWVESFGTGTSIMHSKGANGDPRFSVLGDYGDGKGGARWGWRTELEMPDHDTLVITMTNLSPQGEAIKAVETRYTRKPA